jgi:hypothetical protein
MARRNRAGVNAVPAWALPHDWECVSLIQNSRHHHHRPLDLVEYYKILEWVTTAGNAETRP